MVILLTICIVRLFIWDIRLDSRRFKMKRLQMIPLFIVSVVLSTGCNRKPESSSATVVSIDPVKLQMFQPLPASMPSGANPITDAKVLLGRMLYFEPRLSKSQKISCNSCHLLDQYGVDGQPTSDGHNGKLGDRNSPTVYNAAGHFVQFWDGRAANVEEQAKGPVMNPVEMAMPSERQVVAVLKSMPEYVKAFQRAFPGESNPISFQNMALAIGAFERNLVTPSRWDKFLRGDAQALTDEEKAGFNVFMETGCQGCHAGAYVGGQMYERLGMVKPYPDTTDPGREKVTKEESDRMVFKVPGLRNVAETKPYYHNGKVETLEQAVSRMAEYQLGKNLTEEQVHSIIAWLKTLTGEIPADYVKMPVMPENTAKTPKPNLD
jgi:cytochrome c peroxidase